MWKRNEENSTGRMEWLEKNVRSYLRQTSTTWSVERNVYNVAVRLAMFTALAEVTKEHADDITEWKRNIRCDDS